MSKERRRIKGILDLVETHSVKPLSGLVAKIGVAALDDCAVIPMGSDRDLVVGSDFVRGEDFHLFKKGYLSRRDIGYYLVGANVSDLAAMGASPIGIVVAFRYPSEMSDEEFLEVMGGVCEACEKFSIPLLGGDTGGYPVSVLSAAALGTCPNGRALLRSRGQDGDVLFVSGDLGQAGAALRYFNTLTAEQRLMERVEEEILLNSWRRVEPALLQGCLLAETGLSRCAIDTSDGLKVACEQIAEASGVNVILKEEKIPIAKLAKRVAECAGCPAIELAMGDSVDFRLVFSVAPSDIKEVGRQFSERGWPMIEIGRLSRSETPGAYFETDSGLAPLPGAGWAQ